MSELKFDMTVNAGNILTIFTGVFFWGITLAIAWTKIGNRITMLDFRVELMEKSVEKITSVLEVIAENKQELALMKQTTVTLEAQFATLHNTVEGLRAGKGFIRDSRSDSIDREY